MRTAAQRAKRTGGRADSVWERSETQDMNFVCHGYSTYNRKPLFGRFKLGVTGLPMSKWTMIKNTERLITLNKTTYSCGTVMSELDILQTSIRKANLTIEKNFYENIYISKWELIWWSGKIFYSSENSVSSHKLKGSLYECMVWLNLKSSIRVSSFPTLTQRNHHQRCHL